MVIDTSAAFAIIAMEPDAERFARAMASFEERKMSALSVFELNVVAIGRYGAADVGRVDLLLARANIAIVPFDGACCDIATAAYRRFGKGLHTAALNFGDCASYAVATMLNEPLLFKGTDFSKTDVRVALH
jgi:ribonuclease VapC